jgi:hypothetical protein
MTYVGKNLQSNNVHEDDYYYYYYHHHHHDDTEISGLFQFYAFQAFARQPEWREVMLRSEERSGCVLACLVRSKIEWCSGLRGSSGEISQKLMNLFSVK